MAIAFVGAANGGSASVATSLTYSYTCGSGLNRLLVVAINGDVLTDLITGVTYAGVSMTLIDKQTANTGERWQYLFYLLAPATGANNVVISASGTCDSIASGAADYTGVSASGQPDATTKHSTAVAGNTFTTSITTVTDSSWTILSDISFSDGTPPTAGTGLTRRTFDPSFGSWSLHDSGGVVNPAGSYSMTTNRGSNANSWGHVVAAFKPASDVVVGWLRGNVDIAPPRPMWPQPAAALALTPATLPPVIAGMAWRQPLDDLPPRRLGKSEPSPFGRAIAPSPIPQGWDFIAAIDDQPRKRNFVDVPAIALTPATLPPVIAGIAWFEPPDVYEPKRWFLQDAPGYGRPALSQLIGVPWANWLDILPKAPPKQQPSAALALTPATLPPVIAGMAWFTTTDVYQPRRWFANDPSQVPYVPATVTWSFFSSDTVFLPDPPVDYPPALGRTPPSQPVGISGMAWFEPPDRDRPAVKINGESPPAIALTPATLPPLIAGMAWFEPPDHLPRPAPKPHWGPAAVLIPIVAPTPISGIAWFEPPDRDRPATKVNVESLPAIALTPPSVVASILGMAWFQPPDRDRPAIKFNGESPCAVSLTPATLPPRIAGMAWYVPTDRQRPSLTVTVESLPAYNPTGDFLPAPPAFVAIPERPMIVHGGRLMGWP